MNPYIAFIVTVLIVIRAYRRKNLTPTGIVVAIATAVVHALHPSPLPFTLLFTFFLLGTGATKVKHEVKSTYTLTSGGGSGGEGPRTSVQVLANSGCASVLCLLHVVRYGVGKEMPCFESLDSNDALSTVLLVGIIGNYVSVTADTLSSELGILSKQMPVFVINPTRRVPKGTNGGVTLAGVLYGLLGSTIIAGTSLLFLPFCQPDSSLLADAKAFLGYPPYQGHTTNEQLTTFVFFSIWGGLGSLLDSLLGALLQASVVDRRSGKVVEGAGGIKVLSSPQKRKAGNGSEKQRPDTPSKGGGRFIGSGRDLLDNNQINFLMASIMSVGAMAVAGAIWGVGSSI